MSEKIKARYIIGIDPGTQTGVAMWDRLNKELKYSEAIPIHKAIEKVITTFKGEANNSDDFFFRIEDARLRKWFGKSTKGKEQGAGSIKRDCSIWQDFMEDWGLPFEMVDPKRQTTKMNAKRFKELTGWQGQTNEHGRDAALLCWQY